MAPPSSSTDRHLVLLSILSVLIASIGAASATDPIRFEAEEISEPADAWKVDAGTHPRPGHREIHRQEVLRHPAGVDRRLRGRPGRLAGGIDRQRAG